jgi:3-oxoadipate enol-lactonase
MPRAQLPAIAAALLSLAACAHRPGPGSPTRAERLGFIEGGAGRLRVSDGGEGEPAIVLLHGLGCDLEVWRAQIDHLRARHRVIAYDQRGHGDSDKARDGQYTIDALAQDLDAVIRAHGLGRALLVGHSLSGAVLTRYSGLHPEKVTGLVYVDAVGDFSSFPKAEVEAVLAKEESPSFDAAARRAAFSESLGPKAKPATRQKVIASLEKIDPPAYSALRRSLAQFDPRALALFRGPTLAIEAADVPPPMRAVLAAQALNIQRVELPEVSHWLQLDDPDGLNREIDAFLAGLEAGSPRR